MIAGKFRFACNLGFGSFLGKFRFTLDVEPVRWIWRVLRGCQQITKSLRASVIDVIHVLHFALDALALWGAQSTLPIVGRRACIVEQRSRIVLLARERKAEH